MTIVLNESLPKLFLTKEKYTLISYEWELLEEVITYKLKLKAKLLNGYHVNSPWLSVAH